LTLASNRREIRRISSARVQDIEHPVSGINLDVGAHLRAVRTMYGLSQRELA
jgi:hypothetical protein